MGCSFPQIVASLSFLGPDADLSCLSLCLGQCAVEWVPFGFEKAEVTLMSSPGNWLDAGAQSIVWVLPRSWLIMQPRAA